MKDVEDAKENCIRLFRVFRVFRFSPHLRVSCRCFRHSPRGEKLSRYDYSVGSGIIGGRHKLN